MKAPGDVIRLQSNLDTAAAVCYCSLHLIGQVRIIDVKAIWSDPNNGTYAYYQTYADVQEATLTISFMHFVDYPNIPPSPNNIMVHCVLRRNRSDFWPQEAR